jgi:hypothetical protein
MHKKKKDQKQKHKSKIGDYFTHLESWTRESREREFWSLRECRQLQETLLHFLNGNGSDKRKWVSAFSS